MIYAKLEQEIDDLVQQRYALSRRTFRPLWPWVFVRVLPKEHMVGSVFTVGKQNKPTHEGIVIDTWEPKDVDTVSALIPGDHVLFNHWAGVPVEGFDQQLYRCVKECAWQIDKEGGIFAIVEYDRKNKVREDLLSMLKEGYSDSGLIDMILAEYVVAPKREGSITLSGV